MKLKIVSDGTPLGTQVVDAETGEPLEGLQGVTWSIQIGTLPTVALATLFLYQVPIDAVGQLFQGLKPKQDD